VLTTQLLEFWGVDEAALVDVARRTVGPCDVYIGGSLADDVGTITSDVDLYCFVAGGEAPVAPAPARVGAAGVECHVVRVADYSDFPESLSVLLTDPDRAALRTPYPSPAALRCMHTLYRDRALAPGPLSDAVRRETAADLTHLYVGLRSVISCAASAEDVIAMLSMGEYWTALYGTRLVAEFALDAALAVGGHVNPNTKWRMSLAERAIVAGDLPYDMDGLVPGLFPSPLGDGDPFTAAVALARGCLAYAADGMVPAFPQLATARALVESLAEWVDAGAPTFVRT